MFESTEFRELIGQARAIGGRTVDGDAARQAVEDIRRMLEAGAAAQPTARRRRVLLLSASLAAAMLFALLLFIALQPAKVSAAQALQESAQTTQRFRGWVHMHQNDDWNLKSLIEPRSAEIHLNTADGTIAITFRWLGMLCIEMYEPAKSREWFYAQATNELRITPMEQSMTAGMIKRITAQPLDLAQMLADFKGHGLQTPDVVETADGAWQRFELTFKDDPQKVDEDHRAMVRGKMLIWVDPKTKLIRKTQSQGDGGVLVAEYAYGEPEISDIYSLGVPKDAKTIDESGLDVSLSRPAVMDIPPTTRLVRDDLVNLRELQSRLDRRRQQKWGDYVVIECQQNKEIIAGAPRQGRLTLAAREGIKTCVDNRTVASEFGFIGGSGFPPGWPKPKLADVLAAVARPSPVFGVSAAFDGKNTWRYPPVLSSRSGRSVTRPATMATTGPTTKPAKIFQSDYPGNDDPWPTIGSTSIYQTTKAEAFRDPGRPGLLVLHLITEFRFDPMSPKVNLGTDQYIWLDPDRDDLPVERVSQNILSQGTSHELWLDFGHLPDGRWYPAHWQAYYAAGPSTQPTTKPVNFVDGYVETWRQMFTDVKLPPQWYGDPNKRWMGLSTRPPATQP